MIRHSTSGGAQKIFRIGARKGDRLESRRGHNFVGKKRPNVPLSRVGARIDSKRLICDARFGIQEIHYDRISIGATVLIKLPRRLRQSGTVQILDPTESWTSNEN